MSFSVGYSEMLLVLTIGGLSLLLFRRDWQRPWVRAALVCSVLAVLVTPSDIYSTLVVWGVAMLSLWIGARFMPRSATR